MVVPRAFRTARFAHTRACSTKLSCELAAARDQARDEAAGRGTVDVEPYALCHHLHVIFLQARRSAAVTGVGARIQSVDDCFGLLVHFVSPGIKERLSRQRKVLALPPETDRNETLASSIKNGSPKRAVVERSAQQGLVDQLFPGNPIVVVHVAAVFVVVIRTACL